MSAADRRDVRGEECLELAHPLERGAHAGRDYRWQRRRRAVQPGEKVAQQRVAGVRLAPQTARAV
eukprot:1037048-Pleurochrysis_carterae.AAC.1